MTAPGVSALVGDLRQIASVRRIVLDDGPERGVRALAFSTGGGLDFWALADRSLDIGPLWWRGIQLGWQSPNGFRSPALHSAEENGGRGFERSFSGTLVTCGLDWIRQPKDGQPLHGRLPFTPARVTAYGEDWGRPEPALYCEGEVVQATLNGPSFRMNRRIEAVVGGNSLRICDTITNIGGEPALHALLYHINFGHPLTGAGTTVRLGPNTVLGPISGADPRSGPQALSIPVRPEPQDCRVSSRDGLAADLQFSGEMLPHLQLWTDLRPGRNVLGIEPCTSERLAGGGSGSSLMLEPGETRSYALLLAFSCPV